MPFDDDDPVVEIPEFSHFADTSLMKPIGGTIFAEQLRQAKITFNLALAVGIVGAVVWLGSIAGMLFFELPTLQGVIATASGQITNLLSFFIIRFHRETNSRLDEIRRFQDILELVQRIQDPKLKDEALLQYLRQGGPRSGLI